METILCNSIVAEDGVVVDGWTEYKFCGCADCCDRMRVSVRFWHLLMSMLRLPGRCIACVPISPDVTKILFGARFGFACSLRDAVLWGDHPRW